MIYFCLDKDSKMGNLLVSETNLSVVYVDSFKDLIVGNEGRSNFFVQINGQCYFKQKKALTEEDYVLLFNILYE